MTTVATLVNTNPPECTIYPRIPAREPIVPSTVEADIRRQVYLEIGPKPIPAAEKYMVERKFGIAELSFTHSELDAIRKEGASA